MIKAKVCLKESDGRTKREIEVKVYSSRQDDQSLFKKVESPNEKDVESSLRSKKPFEIGLLFMKRILTYILC